MLIALHILLMAWIVFKSQLFRNLSIAPALVMLVLISKVFFGYAITEYYGKKYGGGDMHNYLNDINTMYHLYSKSPSDYLRTIAGFDPVDISSVELISKMSAWNDYRYRPGFNDARTVIRLHALLRLVSGGQIWIHLIWSNFIWFCGTAALMRFFFQGIGPLVKAPQWAWLLMFIPNSILWTSPILKESLLIFTLGTTLRSFQCWMNRKTLFDFSFFILSAIGFFLVKWFWLAALIPGLAGWYFTAIAPKPMFRILIAYIIVFLFVAMSGYFIPDIYLPGLLFGEQLNMLRFAVFMHAGSLIQPVAFAPSYISIIKHIPDAFFICMTQPAFDAGLSLLFIPLVVENLLFPIMLFILIYQRKWNFIFSKPETCTALLLGLIIILVSGFTTPVAGTLIRYRLPGLILLLLVLASAIASPSKLKQDRGD